MVVFTCNNCGDSLQKPKVAKHYQFQCCNPVFITCIDCHKDFWGDEYIAHTKCMTENERYGGKDYVAKLSTNKGEKKQQAWLTMIQNILLNSTNLTVPERNLLNSISCHENIPRKKAKFFNFIKSLSGNGANMTIVESVWNRMESTFKNAMNNTGNNHNAQNQNKHAENEKKVCKDKIESLLEINMTNSICKTIANKSIKRPLEVVENEDEKSKKKKNKIETQEIYPNKDTIVKDRNSKFSWKNTILDIVTSKRKIPIKKLQKKVIAKYLANFSEASFDKAVIIFKKKLGKISDISIINSEVRLANQ